MDPNPEEFLEEEDMSRIFSEYIDSDCTEGGENTLNPDQRLGLSAIILKEVAQYLGPEEYNEIISSLIALRDYRRSDEFKNAREDQRERESVCILCDAIADIAPRLCRVRFRLAPCPPKYMKISDVTNLLIEERKKSESDEIPGSVGEMNINEWIELHGIVLVGDEDPRAGEAFDNNDPNFFREAINDHKKKIEEDKSDESAGKA